MSKLHLVRDYALLALAVAVIAAAVWFVSETQRAAAIDSADRQQTAQQMLTAMLDQETGLRGFALTRRAQFLQPYFLGRRAYVTALSSARAQTHDSNDAVQAALTAQTSAAARWQALARREVENVRAGRRIRIDSALARKRWMDAFRLTNGHYSAALANERDQRLARAGAVSVIVIIVLATLIGATGVTLVTRARRGARRREELERTFDRDQREFTDMLQVADSEQEAHELLKRHIERGDRTRVLVLNRNNSENRLEARTALPDDSPLGEQLAAAEPRTCLAVRLARPHERDGDHAPLLECELCGASPSQSMCVPLLVGGSVIGSVLVEHEGDFGVDARRRVTESVRQAAPVLANLRTLAVAEARASTDALTGLPNRRAVNDTIKRMLANAGRQVSPLSAVMLDLDHFKQINDNFGHDRGDDVLAAVGDALLSTLRASDFVGRNGGEEFVALLPDTDRDGALILAEKLREAIAKLEVRGVELPISASFGVATFPEDAIDAEGLVRNADRALYVAKSNGRNRVEAAGTAVETTADPDRAADV